MATYKSTPDSQVRFVTALVVAGTDERDLIPMGTSFFVAPFLAVTARHVIDEIFQSFAGVKPWDARGLVGFGVQLGANHPTEGFLKWDVVGYGISPSIDIAALLVEPAEPLSPDYSWFCARLNAVPPDVGTEIHAFGYPKSQNRIDDNGVARFLIDPCTASGDVQAVHPEYRDRSMLPFPCFQTDARFDPGMSGGPVFDAFGRVCGIVSSNIPPHEESEPHISYVSLIWPALGLQVRRSGPVAPGEAPAMALKDLAEDGSLQMHAHDWVSIQDSSSDIHLSFRPR